MKASIEQTLHAPHFLLRRVSFIMHTFGNYSAVIINCNGCLAQANSAGNGTHAKEALLKIYTYSFAVPPLSRREKKGFDNVCCKPEGAILSQQTRDTRPPCANTRHYTK